MNIIKDKLSKSPKEKSTKYETIFDHNITQEELEYLTSARSKDEYLKKIENNNYLDILDMCHNDIAYLYEYREDFATAKKYRDMQSKKALKRYDYPDEGSVLR